MSSTYDYSFFLPGHKGDCVFSGNTVIIPKNTGHHDPHHYFLSYLASCDKKFPLVSPLWLRENGATPICSWFTRRLYCFFNFSVGGHSMHAEGATLLAELRTPPHLIQAIERWKPHAFEACIQIHLILIQALLSVTVRSYQQHSFFLRLCIA
jgi:hypothetical protein